MRVAFNLTPIAIMYGLTSESFCFHRRWRGGRRVWKKAEVSILTVLDLLLMVKDYIDAK